MLIILIVSYECLKMKLVPTECNCGFVKQMCRFVIEDEIVVNEASMEVGMLDGYKCLARPMVIFVWVLKVQRDRKAFCEWDKSKTNEKDNWWFEANFRGFVEWICWSNWTCCWFRGICIMVEGINGWPTLATSG